MRLRNVRRPHTDEVARVANDEGFFQRVTSDSPTVLEGLRVSERDNAGDAVSDVLWEILDGAMGNGGALAVAGDDDFGLRAVDSGSGEKDLHLVDPVGGSTAGVKVGLD